MSPKTRLGDEAKEPLALLNRLIDDSAPSVPPSLKTIDFEHSFFSACQSATDQKLSGWDVFTEAVHLAIAMEMRKGKFVILPEKEFMAELKRTDPKSILAVPAELLRLPYTQNLFWTGMPFFAFDTRNLDFGDQTPPLIDGVPPNRGMMFVFGKGEGGAPMVFNLLLWDGRSIEECLEASRGFERLVDGLNRHFGRLDEPRFVLTLLFLVGTILYTTCTNDYSDRVEPALTNIKKKYRNRTGPSAMVAGTCRIVGGSFARKIKLFREQAATRSAVSGGGHNSPKPHIRAGHFHLYWTGKGRTIPKVNFIHPCLVAADEVGDVEITRAVGKG